MNTRKREGRSFREMPLFSIIDAENALRRTITKAALSPSNERRACEPLHDAYETVKAVRAHLKRLDAD